MDNIDSVFIGDKLLYGHSVMLRVNNIQGFKDFVNRSLGRYVMKDWGEVTEEQKKTNDSVVTGEIDIPDVEVIGIYKNFKTNECLIISTPASHKKTTVFRYMED